MSGKNGGEKDMKKRIAMILAIIATVSTLGSNAVMARSPVCHHVNTVNEYTGENRPRSDGNGTHTWFAVYHSYCTDCEEDLGYYEQSYLTEAHSESSFVSSTRVDDPNHEGYYWYEYTYHCDTCNSDFVVKK